MREWKTCIKGGSVVRGFGHGLEGLDIAAVLVSLIRNEGTRPTYCLLWLKIDKHVDNAKALRMTHLRCVLQNEWMFTWLIIYCQTAERRRRRFLPHEHMRGWSWESKFFPSVCLSVTRVHCDKSKWCTADILWAITLLLWHQQWLVGDAPFPPKSAPKLTYPLRKTLTSTDFHF